ncbi:DUF3592 domain-containing protein [Fodinicola feengrottensis]|uniref:DUF3592 domain-containing protein n=1 Tax=Fodinicola feengrottensis TaxID=435914 RepID=UPI0013D5A2AD|nr:DUF3592 domain-containing protein [Fodinicola feengrottensis]
MWFLLVSLFLVLCMLYGLVRAGRKDWEFFRIRRSGIRVTGEVIGDDPRSRGSSGGYLLVPIVRYDIDGKQTEAPVANSTDKREVGDRLDLVVDPAKPVGAVGALPQHVFPKPGHLRDRASGRGRIHLVGDYCPSAGQVAANGSVTGASTSTASGR